MEKRTISFNLALLSLILVIITLLVGIIVFKLDPQIPLLISTIIVSVVSFLSGMKWSEIENGIIEGIRTALGALIILLVVGVLIASWISGGIVPAMIYYGLKIINPSFFLVTTIILATIVSLGTGSSWTTAGTIGIALMGIGSALNMNMGLVAGAIISGAYTGDKLSPLSDTTNLAAAVSGANLFDHIKHMMYTTIPAYIISLIFFLIMGFNVAGDIPKEAIDEIANTIYSNFDVNLLMLFPPVVVIVLVLKKVPAVPGLLVGVLLGWIYSVVFQGMNFIDLLQSAQYGYVSNTGIESVDALLSNGGISAMMWTISLILLATALGGILEESGILNTIIVKLLTVVKSTGGIILSTVLTSFATNLFAGDQYLAIILPGKMYKKTYEEKGLEAVNLSRTLEDTGTVTSALIPWTTCGATMISFLGISSTMVYLPYAVFNWLSPIFAIIYGYLNITIPKRDTTN